MLPSEKLGLGGERERDLTKVTLAFVFTELTRYDFSLKVV